MSAAWAGPTASILEGPVQYSESFSLRAFVVGAFPQTLADSGGGVLDRGVAPIYPSDGEGVLFSYKFVRTLLALASKVAVGELVAIEVLMYTTV